MEQFPDNEKSKVLVPLRTARRIRYGVVIGHVAAVVIPLAIATVLAWFPEKEPRITVTLYDPALDNVVENPSVNPAPDNPVPPSGTPDAAPQAATPPPPSPPQPQINTKLPRTVNVFRQNQVSQPKIRSIVRPPDKPKNRPKPAEPTPPANAGADDSRSRANDVRPVKPSPAQSGQSSANSGRTGPRGTNSEAGHTAPGGQRGNSGYESQIALMIERMWVTPESVRLGGREPRVLLELHIDPAGRVTGKRIVTKSGVLAMDESVAALLNTLYRVKPPFDGKSHTLTFWLKVKRD